MKELIIPPLRLKQIETSQERHSLHGATTDCYYYAPSKNDKVKKTFCKVKKIFPRGKMIYTKTTVNAQYHWVHNLNRKYDLKIAQNLKRTCTTIWQWLNKWYLSIWS